jgi:D-sedoheptulose 7-phosphate isomerase
MIPFVATLDPVHPNTETNGMKYARLLQQAMEASIRAKEHFLQQPAELAAFDAAVAEVVRAYRNGGRLYIAGNGGSAADAQHLAAEFVCRLGRDRESLPAEALTVDSSVLTAIGNDYGYPAIFQRQLAGKARPGDLFLAISTSGSSENILRALEQCRQMGIRSILFTGPKGDRGAALADHTIRAAGESAGLIQEQHIVFAHTLCAAVEEELFPA